MLQRGIARVPGLAMILIVQAQKSEQQGMTAAATYL
jgi:hypothetical protein